MRCANYTRVSTNEQSRPDHSSLRAQAATCSRCTAIQMERSWDVGGGDEDGDSSSWATSS